ncbi:MAG: hypothetical protein IJ773_01965 [Lachnospiraceae bacterium]|nr:hypothetical protein [Lachnospiraceae bacterium]
MKRKHHLPPGFGTVRYIGPCRTNPYAVHPPAKEREKRPKAICYVPDFVSGLKVLALYHAGLFTQEREAGLFGFQEDVRMREKDRDGEIVRYCKQVLENLDRLRGREEKIKEEKRDIIEDGGQTRDVTNPVSDLPSTPFFK